MFILNPPPPLVSLFVDFQKHTDWFIVCSVWSVYVMIAPFQIRKLSGSEQQNNLSEIRNCEVVSSECASRHGGAKNDRVSDQVLKARRRELAGSEWGQGGQTMRRWEFSSNPYHSRALLCNEAILQSVICWHNAPCSVSMTGVGIGAVPTTMTQKHDRIQVRQLLQACVPLQNRCNIEGFIYFTYVHRNIR